MASSTTASTAASTAASISFVLSNQGLPSSIKRFALLEEAEKELESLLFSKEFPNQTWDIKPLRTNKRVALRAEVE